MGPSYFIKRGKIVLGPFDHNRLKAGIRSQKLRPTDLIGLERDGEYTVLGDVYQDVVSGRFGMPAEEEAVELEEADVDLGADAEPIALAVADDESDELANSNGENLDGENQDDEWDDDLDSLVDDAPGLPPISAGAPRMRAVGGSSPRTASSRSQPGLGFLLNPSGFLSGSVYLFTNREYPSLAAAVRYYAFCARLVYFINRVVIWVSLAISIAVIGVITVNGFSASSGSALVTIAMSFVMLLATLFGFVFLMVLNNLYLILSLAACEVATVFMDIERNTRR